MDCGNEVAGPAFTSPLRHSVPHWYGLIPRRVIAGAGPANNILNIMIKLLILISIYHYCLLLHVTSVQPFRQELVVQPDPALH